MKTRKAILILSIVMIIGYTIANSILTWTHTEYGTTFYFDSTQTSEWFDFWKWVVATGTSITVAKVIKGKTNSDNDEDDPEGRRGE